MLFVLEFRVNGGTSIATRRIGSVEDAKKDLASMWVNEGQLYFRGGRVDWVKVYGKEINSKDIMNVHNLLK